MNKLQQRTCASDSIASSFEYRGQGNESGVKKKNTKNKTTDANYQ